MLKDHAVELIRNDMFMNRIVQTWADLGCGNGLFTSALADLLAKGSKIYAVDKNSSSLKKIPLCRDIIIEKLNKDFIKDNLPGDLDGILMANSFHYVNDKSSLINKIRGNFKLKPFFLIVEYDTDISNPWVPFPISFNSLKAFFKSAGYSSIKKLNERTSVYRRANIYSALIKE